MSDTPRKIFRDKALDKLASPEQLDQLFQVVSPRGWITLATIATAIPLMIIWSIFAQIPVNVEGRGILVYPRQVLSFQSPVNGQIIDINVAAGKRVEAGQVIARISLPDIQQNLELEQQRLETLSGRNQKLKTLRAQKSGLEKESIVKKRHTLKERIAAANKMGTIRANLTDTLRASYENYKDLKDKNLISETTLLEARTKVIVAEETRQKTINMVNGYKAQLQELDIELAKLEQEQVQSESSQTLELQEVKRNIARYEHELRTKGIIKAKHSGRVLEITSSAGQIVTAGQRLGAIEIEDTDAKLAAVAYFTVADGKRIRVDMPMRITPTTVQRERYGSIIGKVKSVSSFPVTTDAITNVIGNAEIAREFTADGSKIEVFSVIEIEPNTFSGFRWTSSSGPDMQVTAGTTTIVRATVESRRPISYAIPILRTWSGFD